MGKTSQPIDSQYMQQALKLAKEGLGKTYPNPMVGAVIVRHNKVLGAGYHHRAGQAHAEIEALQSISGSSKDATLYVNLEPCTHHGKTPPCTDAIIRAKIARVVIATLDPNPLIRGSGVARLRQAGIEVTIGTLEKEAKVLNEVFFGFHEKQRPFIALKFAASLDGKIATASHDSKWITNEKAREYARGLRSQYQAILVGVNTVIYDSPHLGARSVNKSDPLRIILDSTLRIPLKSQVLRDDNVLIITSKRAASAKQKALADRGIPLYVVPSEHIVLSAVMKELTKREIISVLVEGGGTVMGSFVDSRLVNKIYAFYGPLIIGGSNSVPAIGGKGAATISQALQLHNLTYKKLGDTMLISGYSQ